MCRTYGARQTLLAAYPGLTPWANLYRASGAQQNRSEDRPLQRRVLQKAADARCASPGLGEQDGEKGHCV